MAASCRYQISGSLYAEIEKFGDNAPCVTFKRRDLLLMSMNGDEWDTFAKNSERMKKREIFSFTLNMTSEVMTWMGVSLKYFVTLFGNPLHVDSFLTFNENELATVLIYIPLIRRDLLSATISVEKLLNSAHLHRSPANICLSCFDIMRPQELHHGRMPLENLPVVDQLAKRPCTYCGEENDGLDCHCHLYDCKFCEPNNFCSVCKGILCYPDVKSVIGDPVSTTEKCFASCRLEACMQH